MIGDAEGQGTDPIRECGACSACCTVMEVFELGKGSYQPCAHLCGTGCGIYTDRPASCRTFECQWLRGTLEADGSVDPALRPDACGVIFDYRPDTAFGEAFAAWEVASGASGRGRGKEVVDELARSFLIMIMAPGPDGGEEPAGPRFVGPPPRVRQASDVMWSRRTGPDSGG